MALVCKEWIQEFHEAEGHGLDQAPLVEAGLLPGWSTMPSPGRAADSRSEPGRDCRQ